MARKRKAKRSASTGRFMKSNPVSASRKTYARKAKRRRTAPRKNAYLMNAPRKVKRYKRNPPMIGGKILGFGIQDLLMAGAGFVAPPLIEGALSNFIPATLTANPVGKYAVKGGIVAGIGMLGSKMISREAGKMLAIGGATYIIANLIVDYAPTIFSGFGASQLSPGKSFQPSLRAQTGLGAYIGASNGAPSQSGIPDRLLPGARF